MLSSRKSSVSVDSNQSNKIYDENKPYRTIIDYNSADSWPAVKSKFMSKKDAQEMFKAYFN